MGPLSLWGGGERSSEHSLLWLVSDLDLTVGSGACQRVEERGSRRTGSGHSQASEGEPGSGHSQASRTGGLASLSHSYLVHKMH